MATDDLTVVLCDAAQRDRWDAFVQANPASTFCHLYAWKDIIERVYGHRTSYLMAACGSRIAGILPLVLVRRPVLGSSLCSMPFMDYGGVCTDNQDAARLLLARARELMEEHRVDSIELRQSDGSVQLGHARQDKVSMILDLSSGAESIWKILPAKVRNQVRKAEKSGLTLYKGGAELINEFYEIFVVNMRDLGSPVHSKRFFSELCAVFGQAVRVTLIREGTKTIGGLIALCFKDTLLVPWASSLREYFSKCPNNLMYWDAIQDGCKRGCARFDFGRSSVGSGTYDFKKQWGAQPSQLYWQVLKIQGGADTTISADDGKYRLAADLWRRLPVVVTRWIGPRIRKYLTN